MRVLTIETGDGSKGRSFSATVLAYATASGLWEGGAAEAIRPVFLQLACSEAEARPVLANLQGGRKAVMRGEDCLSKGDRVELLRSAGYVFRQQRFAEGVILTAYLHELFVFDPGLVDPNGARLVLMPPRARLEAEAARFDRRAVDAHVRRLGHKSEDPRLWCWLAPMAALFCAALARRSPLPIPPDPRFWAQLYCAALAAGIASWGISTRHGDPEPGTFGEVGALGFREVDAAAVGLAPGVACRVSHAQLEELLAEQVVLFERRRR
ncbi:hypothetical protein WMF30_10650 [Sorangium sp. So ce134]